LKFVGKLDEELFIKVIPLQEVPLELLYAIGIQIGQKIKRLEISRQIR
jgi:hypothetical protein